MAKLVHILYCDCSYSQTISEEVKRQVRNELSRWPEDSTTAVADRPQVSRFPIAASIRHIKAGGPPGISLRRPRGTGRPSESPLPVASLLG